LKRNYTSGGTRTKELEYHWSRHSVHMNVHSDYVSQQGLWTGLHRPLGQELIATVGRGRDARVFSGTIFCGVQRTQATEFNILWRTAD
jgi:hypothetical protein